MFSVEALTCSYPHAPHINAVAANFYREMDEMTSDNKSSICAYVLQIKFLKKNTSRKHVYIILTLLNPTFVQKNWGLQGYT